MCTRGLPSIWSRMMERLSVFDRLRVCVISGSGRAALVSSSRRDTAFSIRRCTAFQERESTAMYYLLFDKRKEKGFYLEMGALDGVNLSNTFNYNRCLGWNGLLIEANPNAADLAIKNRYTNADVKDIVYKGAFCDTVGGSLDFEFDSHDWSKGHTGKDAGGEMVKVNVPCNPVRDSKTVCSFIIIHHSALVSALAYFREEQD